MPLQAPPQLPQLRRRRYKRQALSEGAMWLQLWRKCLLPREQGWTAPELAVALLTEPGPTKHPSCHPQLAQTMISPNPFVELNIGHHISILTVPGTYHRNEFTELYFRTCWLHTATKRIWCGTKACPRSSSTSRRPVHDSQKRLPHLA